MWGKNKKNSFSNINALDEEIENELCSDLREISNNLFKFPSMEDLEKLAIKYNYDVSEIRDYFIGYSGLES
jgi:hypothetical protein